MKSISFITIITITLCSTTFGSFVQFPAANGQTDDPLPVILIHGYRQDASSWHVWENLLRLDGIPHYAAHFVDGQCGSSEIHANELRQIVEQVKQETGSEKVNMVGFSKGGLDARVYLEDGSNNVENLIMIGTPNGGAPLAYWDFICHPAANDLEFGSHATQSTRNPYTNYYTIYGDPVWYLWGNEFFPQFGNPFIPGRDDGFVQIWSVNSEEYFKNLGNTNDHHNMLQTQNEYDVARSILLGN